MGAPFTPRVERRRRPGMSKPQARSPRDGPFCWQSKAARRLIRQKLPTSKISSALGVYDALTEISSDNQSDTFDAAQNYIGLYAGVSGKTVQRISPDLEQLGLVAIKSNYIGGRNAECTYTLLPLGHNVRTPGHGRKQPCCPTIEESPEESKKNVVEETKAPSATATTTNFEELLAELKPLYPDNDVRRELDRYFSWCKKKEKTPTVRGFRNWMKRAEPELKRAKAKAAGMKPIGFKSPAPLPIDPVKHAEFLRKLNEWRANGRPLGAFPTT
jgi:hypothetical protein